MDVMMSPACLQFAFVFFDSFAIIPCSLRDPASHV